MYSFVTGIQFVLLVLGTVSSSADASFAVLPLSRTRKPNAAANNGFLSRRISSSSLLASSPQPTTRRRRQPRRNLKKRRHRQASSKYPSFRQLDEHRPGGEAGTTTTTSYEIKPLIASRSIEAGTDYWIPEEDIHKEQLRQLAVKNRKAMEGEVPKSKLWEEVKAPYKQNWIGVSTIFVVALAVIIQNFPELLDQPIISIPDL